MDDAKADETFVRRAIQLSEKAMTEGAGPPFGAVVVRGGQVLAEGFNNSVLTKDPTAHAEIVAIRLACAAIGHHRLDGCTIYSSSEPCPMCLSAIYWAGIKRICYANDVATAAEAGFDDRRLYRELAAPAQDRTIPASQLLADEGRTVFDAWRARRKNAVQVSWDGQAARHPAAPTPDANQPSAKAGAKANERDWPPPPQAL